VCVYIYIYNIYDIKYDINKQLYYLSFALIITYLLGNRCSSIWCTNQDPHLTNKYFKLKNFNNITTI
jgi:hypothetical protein